MPVSVVCFLRDQRWNNLETAGAPLAIDYLYVCRGYKGNIAGLTSLFSIGMVIFEPSYSAYYRELIVRDCIRLGISYLSLDEQGAVRFVL